MDARGMELTKTPWLEQLRQQRAIAVIRAPKFLLGQQMAMAVAAGGLELIEITWDSQQAPRLIAQLRQDLPTCQVGVGTLLTVADLQAALRAGAQFCFSPHVDSAMIATAIAHDIPMIPGALSPTEILTAWQAGASCVKVFPVGVMGGCDYIRALQGPLGHIPLIPTGGIKLAQVAGYVQAGAIAMGLASDLFPPTALAEGNWAAITQRTQALLTQLAIFATPPP